MTATPFSTVERLRALEWWTLGIAMVGYVVAAAVGLSVRSPLGHDESMYALRARDLDTGWATRTDGWTDYRAPGLPVMLNGLGRFIGIHVTSSRLLVVVLGAAVLLSTWALGRVFGSGLAGAFGALVVSLTSGFVFSSSTLLADVPGAAFAMVAICVYAWEAKRARLRWSFVLVPLFTIAATVARFGAPLMIGAGLVAVTLIVLPNLVRTRNWICIGQSAMLGVGVALSAGLIVLTDLVSVGPLSPAKANQLLIGGKGLTASTGLKDLLRVVNPLTDHPVHLWSPAVAAMCLGGVVIGIALARSPGPHRDLVVLGVVAGFISTLSIAVTVGLVVANYLALSLPFWALAAGAGWAGLAERVLQSGRRPLQIGSVLVTTAVVAILFIDLARDNRALHLKLQTDYESLRSVSLEANSLLGDNCLIVTSSTPQVAYYSECAVQRFSVWADVTGEEALVDALERRVRSRGQENFDAVAVMVQEGGKRQPPAESFLVDDVIGPEIASVGAPGDGRQYVRLHVVNAAD